MKVWNYMAIMLGMIIFLTFMGFDLTSSSTELLNDTGVYINSTDMGQSNIDISDSSWFSKLFDKVDGLVVLLGLGGAIIIGLFGKTLDWKLVLGVPFFSIFGIKFARVGFFMAQLTDEAWLKGIIITIFGVLTVMYIFSIFEWFASGDN
jgi:hypothetical protein